ncbi:hypothetical protein P167DRAFT_574386 [Morchella conica CCBAS932]|uniref:Uncharacterized protein n=1 Tax=Morchella conica CCBAS932 TaxID=1392247 RepID=A0A3N4KVF9_9PEZI|nr:hypothetical protein P167DRAFT_574386 [Morchella conica CCBAS932]
MSYSANPDSYSASNAASIDQSLTVISHESGPAPPAELQMRRLEDLRQRVRNIGHDDVPYLFLVGLPPKDGSLSTPTPFEAAEQQPSQLKREIAASPDPAAHAARNQALIDSCLAVIQNSPALTPPEGDEVIEEYDERTLTGAYSGAKTKLRHLRRRVKEMTFMDGMMLTAQAIPPLKPRWRPAPTPPPTRRSIKRTSTPVYYGDDVTIITDEEGAEWEEEEYIRRTPREWMCEQYKKRVASIKRKIERGKKMDGRWLVISFIPRPGYKWGP